MWVHSSAPLYCVCVCVCSLTAPWITCSVRTKLTSFSHVTCAAPLSGAWRKPACAAVSHTQCITRLHSPLLHRVPHGSVVCVCLCVCVFSVCKMVCHRKCMSKITTHCSKHLEKKVSVICTVRFGGICSFYSCCSSGVFTFTFFSETHDSTPYWCSVSTAVSLTPNPFPSFIKCL